MTRPFSPQEQMALQQAVALHQNGRLSQAFSTYQQLLAIQPDNADVLRLAGTALAQAERFEDAVAFLSRSLTLQANADTCQCLGNALRGLRRYDEAMVRYNQVLAARPNDADAFNARGNVWADLKRFPEAFADYDRALALVPGHLDALLNRAIALQGLNRLDEALAGFDQVLSADPGDADALYQKAGTLEAMGRLEEALVVCESALRLRPGHAETHNTRGNILFVMGRIEEALENYDRALAIKPDIEWLPGHDLYVRMYLSDWRDFAGRRDRLEQAILAGKRTSAPLPVQALIDSPKVLLTAAKTFAEASHPAGRALPPITPYKHERLRIGYFSSDFKNHPVSHLLAALFERHDRSKVEVFAFSLRPQAEDAWRTRIRQAADHFIDVAGLSDIETAKLARQHEIDIAVSLNGFTYGSRTGVFAERAAPVQVSYLGYLGTMGADYIDYLLADNVIVPPEKQAFYSEKITYLPSYQANDDAQAPSDKVFDRAGQGLPETGFVFCSFNQNYKITPDAYDGWMRILLQTPGSVLWLHAKNRTAIAHLKAEAAARGVDPERIVFAAMLPLDDHLARLPLADLFLDSHPYNAGATASNALRMGLPVLTRIGESFAARMGASLLTAVGMPELITDTPEAYEALAVRLATQPGELAAIKAKLQANLPGSLLFDTDRAARGLEAAFADMIAATGET